MHAATVVMLGRICVVAIGASVAVFTKAVAIPIDAFAARAVAVHPAIIIVAVGSSGAARSIAISVVIDAFSIRRQITGARRRLRAGTSDHKEGRDEEGVAGHREPFSGGIA